MSEEPQQPAQPSRAKRTALAVWGFAKDFLSTGALLAVGGLLILLVVGLFGGWDRATAARVETLATVAPSATATAEPFAIQPRKAFHADELQPIAFPQDGVRYLMVTFQVTNEADIPTTALRNPQTIVIDAEGLATFDSGSVADPELYRLGDALAAPALQPHLPSTLVAVWKQDASTPVPDEVTVTFSGHTYREASFGTGKDWLDPLPAFQVTLPVEEVDQ